MILHDFFFFQNIIVVKLDFPLIWLFTGHLIIHDTRVFIFLILLSFCTQLCHTHRHITSRNFLAYYCVRTQIENLSYSITFIFISYKFQTLPYILLKHLDLISMKIKLLKTWYLILQSFSKNTVVCYMKLDFSLNLTIHWTFNYSWYS